MLHMPSTKAMLPCLNLHERSTLFMGCEATSPRTRKFGSRPQRHPIVWEQIKPCHGRAQVQNTYIPVILGVEYALLVALAILATVLLVLGRLCAGGFFLLLYWIWLTVVMFSGPGARPP